MYAECKVPEVVATNIEESQPRNKHHQLGVKALMPLPSKDGRRKVVTSLSPCRKRQGKRCFLLVPPGWDIEGWDLQKISRPSLSTCCQTSDKKHKKNDHILPLLWICYQSHASGSSVISHLPGVGSILLELFTLQKKLVMLWWDKYKNVLPTQWAMTMFEENP